MLPHIARPAPAGAGSGVRRNGRQRPMSAAYPSHLTEALKRAARSGRYEGGAWSCPARARGPARSTAASTASGVAHMSHQVCAMDTVLLFFFGVLWALALLGLFKAWGADERDAQP